MGPQKDPAVDLERGFCVGDWQVRPLAGTLARSGHTQHVEPKVMDVLVYLARRQRDIVTREELLREVWGGVVVGDEALTRCVSELRTLLGDTDRERRYIRTIPKRGYGLILPIRPLETGDRPERDGRPETIPAQASAQSAGEAPAARSAVGRSRPSLGAWKTYRYAGYGVLVALAISAAATLIREYPTDTLPVGVEPQPGDATASGSRPPVEPRLHSLAVLPFADLGGNEEHGYFSDGLAEDIRNALITATELRIAGRTSSHAFRDKAVDIREIGTKLGVDALVEGTVRISGNRLRVTAQLTDATDGYPLWAASYESELGDRIQAQVDVAGKIVRQLAPLLDAGLPPPIAATGSLAAHEYYLLGRHHWHQRTPESLEQAIAYFEQALAFDAEFALAYAGLADAHVFQISYANRRVEEALPIGRRFAERAIELGPQLAEAHASMGLVHEHALDLDAARDSYQRAVELKPGFSMAQMWLGNVWMGLQHPRRAFDHYSTALELDPLHPQVQGNYIYALTALGRYPEAEAAIDRFFRFGQDESLLRKKLGVYLSAGQYDRVLTAAVERSFSGEFTPHNNEAVIESLIHLHRFEEAEQMIRDNEDAIEEPLRTRLQAQLAIARRDADGLRRVAEGGRVSEPGTSKSSKAACGTFSSRVWGALADFIANDFEAAAAGFEALARVEDPPPCVWETPEVRIEALSYLAASRLKLDADDEEARRLLATARQELAVLRERGWDTPALAVAEIGVRLVSGDPAGAESVLGHVQARDWQPYGRMWFAPLFDAYRTGDKTAPRLAELERGFESLAAECEAIGLTKLGL